MPEARTKKSALFIRCSEEQAERIRRDANAERRTISGYILNAVLNRIEAKEKLLREQDNLVQTPKAPLLNIPRLVDAQF